VKRRGVMDVAHSGVAEADEAKHQLHDQDSTAEDGARHEEELHARLEGLREGG